MNCVLKQTLSYQQVLQILSERAYLPGLPSQGSRPDNMPTMAKLLGHPEKKFPSIHIAGTNGKGSVSLKISKALEYSGYRCGLFTSPHISNFRERIAIGDQLISEDQTAILLTEILEASQKAGISLTYFEYCTLLAFLYFAQEKVDVAVIEVGLGGRLDATNILLPIASIITSISKDHTELLGFSNEEIAAEKAGIIKPFTPVIVGPNAPLEIFSLKAALEHAPLTAVKGTFTHYGLENQAIAKGALDLLKHRFQLEPKAIEKALQLEPSCRFEVVPKEMLAHSQFKPKGPILLDVAHNPDGFTRLIQRLKIAYPKKRYVFALSFSTKKDISKCAQILSESARSIYILDIDHPKLAPTSHIEYHFAQTNLPVIIGTPEQILERTSSEMSEQDVFIICGSFFIMDPIRTLLGYHPES